MKRWDMVLRVFMVEYMGLQPIVKQPGVEPTSTARGRVVERSGGEL